MAAVFLPIAGWAMTAYLPVANMRPNRQLAKIREYIRKWEGRGYANGIPDEAPMELETIGKAPSYRRICIAILKNDVACESLGYAREKCAAYMEIKRVEIMNRRGK